jgi:hypothetical protein
MNIELFSANCSLCYETEQQLRRVMGPKCTLRVYDLARGEGVEEAKKYSIRAVPTIVGNGKKMFEGVPAFEELLACSLEHGCKGRLLIDTSNKLDSQAHNLP